MCSGTNILGMDFNGLYRYKMTMPPVHLLKQYSKMVVEIETKKVISLRKIKNSHHFVIFTSNADERTN